MTAPARLGARLDEVRLLVLDVDGVLTDGTLYYGPAGEALKAFHVRDGLGMKRLQAAGVEVAVVTGREGEALGRRLAELGVRRVLTGRDDKGAALEELLAATGVAPGQVACVGDDVLDLPMLRRAAVAIAVADAHPAVRAEAHWVTVAVGGRGAVREVADGILGRRAAAGEGDGFRVVIPTRWGATRLPGKPLRPLAGRPMVAHVWDRAAGAGAREVIVATDDERIRAAVAAFGGRAVLTSPDHPSGTDRLAEVARAEGWPDGDVVVNLQGDEPLVDGALVRRVAAALAERPEAGIATLATPVREAAELFDPNVVKVVLDDGGMARWFSRAPVPWARGAFEPGRVPAALPPGVPFLRHLGLYAYRVGVLRRLAAERPRPAELAESLEQLRALALGIGVHVTVIDRAPPPGVDTEEDLARVERALAGREGGS